MTKDPENEVVINGSAVDIKTESINIPTDSINTSKKAKGITGLISKIVNLYTANKERRTILKEHENMAYQKQKAIAAEAKLEKDIEAAKKRGEFKAKPLQERIKIKREEVQARKAAKNKNISVDTTKKETMVESILRGSASMIAAQKNKKQPLQLTVGRKTTLRNSTQIEKKTWK